MLFSEDQLMLEHWFMGWVIFVKHVNLSILPFDYLHLMIMWLYLFNYRKTKYKILIITTCKNDSAVSLNWRPINCSKYMLNVLISFIISWFLFLETSIKGNNGHHKFKINRFWIHPLLKATCRLGKIVI